MKGLVAIASFAVAVALFTWHWMQSGDVAQSRRNDARESLAMAAMQTDMATLARLISLEVAPTSARWETHELPGGQDWELIALLHYEPAAMVQLSATMQSQPGSYELMLPEWAQVVAAAAGIDGSPARFETILDPAPFRKSPLLTGFAVQLGDAHLLVVLQTQ